MIRVTSCTITMPAYAAPSCAYVRFYVHRRQILARPDMSHLELYVFRVILARKKLDIRLDSFEDLYGSPSIDAIEKFSR